MPASTHIALKIVVCAALALLVTILTTQTIVSSVSALSLLPTAKSIVMEASASAAALPRLG